MTRTEKDVESKVMDIIATALCADRASVHPKAILMRDLAAESIDFLDIMFNLEKEFNIRIQQREIETKARGGIDAEEFEKDSVLQTKGAERLAQMLPEIAEHIKPGMHLRELPQIFTVEVFINIVKRKLEGELSDDANPVPSANVISLRDSA